MIITYATKRNANGNRKYLVIDTDARTYARDITKMFLSREDFVEISATDRKALIELCEAFGYEKRGYIWEQNFTKRG